MRTYRSDESTPRGATHFNTVNRMFYRDLEDQPLQRWSSVHREWVDCAGASRAEYTDSWERVK